MGGANGWVLENCVQTSCKSIAAGNDMPSQKHAVPDCQPSGQGHCSQTAIAHRLSQAGGAVPQYPTCSVRQAGQYHAASGAAVSGGSKQNM